MIDSAAVRILRNDREIVIPVHRHCDAYEILYLLNIKDYMELDEGFLIDNEYVNRQEAMTYARKYNLLKNEPEFENELYSEDLW